MKVNFHFPTFNPRFEEACKELNIPLYVLPPYSPKQNGRIEAQSPSYASLLAITNLLLGEVRNERSEDQVCPDHVHILVEIPPKLSISSFMGFLKGKTSIMIYQKYGNMKFKYRNRNFWCRGYYVDTAGKDAKKIQKYIQDQLKEDELSEQLTLDLGDPFMGSK